MHLSKRTFTLLLVGLVGLQGTLGLTVWGAISLGRKGLFVPGELWLLAGVALGAVLMLVLLLAVLG